MAWQCRVFFEFRLERMFGPVLQRVEWLRSLWHQQYLEECDIHKPYLQIQSQLHAKFSKRATARILQVSFFGFWQERMLRPVLQLVDQLVYRNLVDGLGLRTAASAIPVAPLGTQKWFAPYM